MTTCEPALPGGELFPGHRWTSSPEDSRASRSASPDAVAGTPTNDGSGLRCGRPFAIYDPSSRCWRTCQASLLAGLDEFSETWPRSGMTRDGTAYRLPPSAPLTDATGGGASPGWPTPTVKGNHNRAGASPASGDGLSTAVNRWPTPTARLGESRQPSPRLARERLASGRRNLEDAISAASDNPGHDLRPASGGPLNPEWVEILLGLPAGWTEV